MVERDGIRPCRKDQEAVILTGHPRGKVFNAQACRLTRRAGAASGAGQGGAKGLGQAGFFFSVRSGIVTTNARASFPPMA